MRAIIIGGGIAGLSTAVALRRVGIQVEVHEKASALCEVAAGISVWANAMRALEAIGAAEAVRAIGQRVRPSEFRVEDGHESLMSYDCATLERRYGVMDLVTMVHRQELVEALAWLLPPTCLHFGHELASIKEYPPGEGIVATFANGESAAGDILIGADGLRSSVRRHVLEGLDGADEAPRYSGYTSWRGVCEAPESLVPMGYVGEFWGSGKRVGVTSLSRGRCYWWMTENAAAGGQEEDERAHLLRSFGSWATPVPQLLELTESPRIIRTDIADRPPRRGWHKGRVVLVGDAAHATTPNLGQGACMAIEDAPVLARSLAAVARGDASPTNEALSAAFAEFEAERFPRTSAITKQSWSVGRIGQMEHPVLTNLRDLGAALTPPRLAYRSMMKWARHDVGAVDRAGPGRRAAGTSERRSALDLLIPPSPAR